MANIPVPNINRPPAGMSRGRVLSPEEFEKQRQKQELKKVVPKTEGAGWAGLVLLPKHVSFETQNVGEQVFIMLRRHWFTNLSWVFNSVLFALLPILAYAIADLFKFNLITVLGWKIAVISVLMYYSFWLTNLIRNFSDWYFDVYLVTNERVIDYDFQPFVAQEVSETALRSIEDVRERTVGFFPQMFDYGDLSIYSAADKLVITFDSIPKPTFVRDKILDLAAVVHKQDN